MVLSRLERRKIGYEVERVLVAHGHLDELVASSVEAAPPEGETFPECWDRIGGIVAEALEERLGS